MCVYKHLVLTVTSGIQKVLGFYLLQMGGAIVLICIVDHIIAGVSVKVKEKRQMPPAQQLPQMTVMEGIYSKCH